MTASGPARHDQAETGLLEVDTTINSIPVNSVFTLLKQAASQKTLADYASEAGVSEQDIIELATELTSHGKRAGIDAYRGPAKHPYGFYAIQAINTLCALVGSFNWKGGMSPGGGSRDDLGGKTGQPYPIAKLHPGKTTHFGVNVSREGLKYDESTLFKPAGYPAKRPWYPFAFEMFHDVIPAAGAGYPYPVKLLWLHMGTPAYSIPGGGEQIKILKDPKKIPLVIATDMVVGETTMYTDYVFPDISYLEQWASPGDVPVPPVKSNPIRQPVVEPVTEVVSVFGQQMPLSMEALMLAIAEEMGLPGFGPNGFGSDMDLKRPEDFYLKIVANLAFGDKADGSDAVPDASSEEIELFRRARRHLPPSVFDEAKWRTAVGESLWTKAVTVLNRGGRFNSVASAYDGERLANRFEGTLSLFLERVSKTTDSITGVRWDGLPRLKPPTHSDGTPIVQGGYAFTLVTFKEVFATQSRTISNYWSQSDVLPENFVIINLADGLSLGLSDGDRVRVVSQTLPDGVLDLGNGNRTVLEARVKLSYGVRPGTVLISHHYGHWAYGASAFAVDGVTVSADPRRAGGIPPNPLLLLDRYMQTAPITDPVGGSAVFFQTKVNLVKV
jgi:anaerobic selenocysteine-containing dehydrogenase